MMVYGVGLLAVCMLSGMYLGELLGDFLGVSANVGGVGIAMVFLLLFSNLSNHKYKLSAQSSAGIEFWSAMYIPIVVAMAAKQNVFGAISGGWMAITAGLLAVTLSFLMIPVLSRLGASGANDGEGER